MLPYFIGGVAAGMMLHRLIIIQMLDELPTNICHYCQWDREKRKRD